MRNLAAIILLVIFTSSAVAQRDYSSYRSDYLGKKYDIMVHEKNDSYKLYIDATPQGDETGGFMLKENETDQFLQALNTARGKYLEWVATAKQNNVTDVDKEIEIKTPGLEAYFKYGDWQFAYFRPKFYFRVLASSSDQKVHYLLLMRTGSLTSSTNQFIKTKGVMLVLEEESEIDALTAELAPAKVKAFLSKPNTEDIFK